jgi:hypothetical protein
MRFLRGWGELVLHKVTLGPQTISTSTTTNGTVVNRTGEMGSLITANIQSISGTGASVYLQLQTGTLSNGSDMANAIDKFGNPLILGPYTAQTLNIQKAVDMSGLNDYVRLAAVSSATAGSPTIVLDAAFILGGADNLFEPLGGTVQSF